jgi:hypothetical protein
MASINMALASKELAFMHKKRFRYTGRCKSYLQRCNEACGRTSYEQRQKT